MHRKDRVFEALRSLCTQRPAQSSALRRHAGFSAEEVAEVAEVDRTNASRDLNLLAQQGLIERFPGRPVLFSIKASVQEKNAQHTLDQQNTIHYSSSALPTSSRTAVAAPVNAIDVAKPSTVAASVQVGAVVTSFETLIGDTEALKVAIQQAKAAILYPPRGLHTLLYGPSGVGKTTFARLMHAYALELAALPADAPFISFNCADYAGNPQLLMSHLFGVVRGAYTGADKDKIGLVEQAHRGILFLDEVHRLPPEGQEMLFYLMDRERFRRLGDVRERTASVLLLAATTEDPTIVLLPTFRRRIPMTITLPGLQERSTHERYELLRAFFTTECSSIGAHIHVAPQALRALMLYECPGNIGQLRTDVQLSCARAYLAYRTNNLSELSIDLDVLPEHVRQGLLRTAELRRVLEPLQQQLEAVHIFTPTGLSLDSMPESAQDLYETISNDLTSLQHSGLRADEIHKLLHLDIQHYFERFAHSVTQGRSDTMAHLVDERVAAVSQAIVQYAEEQLGRVFPEKLPLVLALHLSSTIEHVATGRQLMGSTIQSMRQTYPIEYEVAHVALLRVRSTLNITLPENETDVLTILLANADTLLSSKQAMVGVVVAAHGRGIASGMAELANTLVGVDSVLAVELSLEQSPETLLTQVAQSATAADQGRGVLLLVDFSSLLSLGDLVSQRTGIQVRALSGASTPLLVEAVRKAQQSVYTTLEQLANSLAQFRVLSDQDTAQTYPLDSLDVVPSTSRVILSVCLTGFGSATKLAELMQENLPDLHRQGIEILCMDINLSGKTEAEVQQLVGQRSVVAIVGTINPHLESYPFISLTDMLFGDGIARLRTLVGSTLIDPALLQPEVQSPQPLVTTSTTPIFTQRAELIHAISQTLTQRMLFLNPARALPLIDRMIEMIEIEVGETFDIEVLAGLILHLTCILERGTQQKDMLVSETVRQSVEQQFARELSICRHALQILSTQVMRILPDEEAYNIVGILRQVDIFME